MVIVLVLSSGVCCELKAVFREVSLIVVFGYATHTRLALIEMVEPGQPHTKTCSQW
jgi:hypothetical protein